MAKQHTKLHYIMQSRNITTAQLREGIRKKDGSKYTHNSIMNWRCARNLPNVRVGEMIAKFLDVPFEGLFGIIDPLKNV